MLPTHFNHIALLIQPPKLRFTFKTKHWIVDLIPFRQGYVISDDKPFNNTMTQHDICLVYQTLFQSFIPKRTTEKIWILVHSYLLCKMKPGPVSIANQLSILTTLYLGIVHQGKLVFQGKPIYSLLMKPSTRRDFDVWNQTINWEKPLFYFDSSSLNPTATLIGGSSDIWIEVLDYILHQHAIELPIPINLKRDDKKAVMCGACVPYSCGMGRLTLGMGYLQMVSKENKQIYSVHDTKKCTTRSDFVRIDATTDLGVLMMYNDLNVHVNNFPSSLTFISHSIKQVLLNGQPHLFSPSNPLIVNYNGGHVFSFYNDEISI